ncbi:MAG: chemotaxis-specific protein-glutamate methyltransferase CheB [Bdellovibrio sp.]|nr:chemotaxis-specific protein-glutamate methyltransferase CheB [Bdellovibrio sp.]
MVVETRAALVLSPQQSDLAELSDVLSSLGYHVRTVSTLLDADAAIRATRYSLFFAEVDLSSGGDAFLPDEKQLNSDYPPCILIRNEMRPIANEKACLLGIHDFLYRPFTMEKIIQLMERMTARHKDPLLEILHIITIMTGVQMGERQRTLVQTRLIRRMRTVGHNTEQQYINYFRKNRAIEIPALVSLMTTHTTEWFRESSHFDWMYDEFLPKHFTSGSVLRIWSAACSTGQEVYSIAITVLEYLRQKGISIGVFSEIKIIGTDIDKQSVEQASNGVYDAEELRKINPDLVARYFDRGTGDFVGLCRVKDEVWKLCEFHEMNLLAPGYGLPEFNLIFARNVFIYFNPDQIGTIVEHMRSHMKPEARLLIGRSESISSMKTTLQHIGDSIYKVLQGSDGIREKGQPIRVFIIDDSSTIRKLLHRMLSMDQGFLVVGEAENPIQADAMMKNLAVDVITLDIHMPEMDGITYLSHIKERKHPPIVMLSSVNQQDAVDVFKCFDLGAVDYIEKPKHSDLAGEAERIRDVLRAAAIAKSDKDGRTVTYRTQASIVYKSNTGRDLILIGASTGGTEAIRAILRQFPANSPPVVIVQHIPAVFSRVFADRLSEICQIDVKEAQGGEILQDGHAYIAQGGKQLGIITTGKELGLKVTDDQPINRHKPSVDYLFESALQLDKRFKISAALLTGMGVDGARGMLKLRKKGAHTIAQDESTCVVYGMPRAAVDMGAAIEVLPLQSISYHLFMALNSIKKVA